MSIYIDGYILLWGYHLTKIYPTLGCHNKLGNIKVVLTAIISIKRNAHRVTWIVSTGDLDMDIPFKRDHSST